MQEKSLVFRNYNKVSGIVVPHHDIVKAQREEFFKKIEHDIAPPKTVILIGPNHFDVGKGTIQTTDKVWNVGEGIIEPNLAVINALPASVETSSFKNEHAIYLILADIKRTWPEANIVPIILKTSASHEAVQKLTAVLVQECKDCLLIASVDFSHYQPAVLANEHDQLTLRAMQNLDEELIRSKAEVDSPATLQLMLKWAKSHDTRRFVLHRRTNSGELLSDPDIETTTHFFGYYTTGLAVEPPSRVSFLIGGDMMFARGIHATFEKDLRQSVAHLGDRLFWGTDLSLINLEGAISETPVTPDPGPTFDFDFPPETVDVLKYMRINAISQDNNHASNGNPATTRELLEKQNISVLPVTVQGEGLKLTVIGIHTLWGVRDITEQIREIKKDADQRVIIFPHWGEEYKPIHTKQQQDLAHAWIDAGADLVIGAHPHVIQDGEIYKGKPIIYSIGNLLFDQDWSQATQEGMLISGAFTEDGLELFGLPVISKNHQPELARGVTKARLLKKIEGAIIQL